jgi:uncharacterized protein (TIGR02145 family)
MRTLYLIIVFYFTLVPAQAQLFGGQIKTKKTLATQYPAGTVHCGGTPTAVVDVTNPVTGKTWMDRNLGASRVAQSSTDNLAYGDLYQWGRRSDGHQCRNSSTINILSLSDQGTSSSFIAPQNYPYDWRNPQNANLWQGINGVNNPCPIGYRVPTDAEFDEERLNWSSQSNNGAFLSPIKLTMAGYKFTNASLTDVGNLGIYWTSVTSNIYSKYLNFNINIAAMGTHNRACGFSLRCIKETVGTIGSINCGGSTVSGNLISGQAASNVTATVPYTGGNAGFYASQSISSSGVTGLTASISQGLFASGSGNLMYSITGTPSTNGTASFALNIGGQSCTLTVSVVTLVSLYPAGSVFCNGPTAILDVTNPVTGKTWMDRNLGASQVASSSTDANSYGDLYQWGRRADGHQCRNSATTSTLSSSDQPGNGSFILAPNTPNDWRSPQNTNLWQGVNGVNNPCPSGYRVPTETEWTAEDAAFSTQNAAGAFASPLKLPLSGGRNLSSGSGTLFSVGTYGFYWSSSVSSTSSRNLYFYSSIANMNTLDRGYGFTVRCLKD